jgi:hypothetical protein
MKKKIRLYYDFIRLWIKWRDRKEAWEDAQFINDEEIQRELADIDRGIRKHFEDLENGVH